MGNGLAVSHLPPAVNLAADGASGRQKPLQQPSSGGDLSGNQAHLTGLTDALLAAALNCPANGYRLIWA
ncbi:MAG TPA: hypothetical protein DDY43_14520 [Synechococcales bacterium UBA10510]|nr:hypothetical protein [Synechococcales bacterium UBA10510]